MTLEELLSENTAAVKALTASYDAARALNGAPDKTPAEKPPSNGKGAGKDRTAKPKHTYEQASAAILLVKNEIGTAAAREIIERYAGAGKKLGDLANMPDKFDAIVADCDTAIANKPEPEAPAEEEL